MKIIASNVCESTEKLTSKRKSLVKQQILMYKTAVYRLVNGGITRQKQQISEKGDIAWQYIDTWAMCCCVVSPFQIFAVLTCNAAVN